MYPLATSAVSRRGSWNSGQGRRSSDETKSHVMILPLSAHVLLAGSFGVCNDTSYVAMWVPVGYAAGAGPLDLGGRRY